MNKVIQQLRTKPTVNDIARHAGVSLATVDRVLNDRPGVRTVTIERVNRAVDQLGYIRDTAAANLAKQRVYRFLFLLPNSQGGYFDYLQSHVEEQAAQYSSERTYLRTTRVSTFNSNETSSVLDSLSVEDTDGVALVAPETPAVRDAVARARERGITVVALLTDLPSSPRDHFVGVNNVKAGQTAATLMGRFTAAQCKAGSKLLVLTDSRFSRGFLERRNGFESTVAQNFPHLLILPTCVIQKGDHRAEKILPQVIKQWPEIVGIYSTTTNNDVLIRFLESNQHPLSVVAHELTPVSENALKSGWFDAIISQDATHIVGSAVRLMRSTVDDVPYNSMQERCRIEIYLKENLPEF